MADARVQVDFDAWVRMWQVGEIIPPSACVKKFSHLRHVGENQYSLLSNLSGSER